MTTRPDHAGSVSSQRFATGEPSGFASSLYMSTFVERRFCASGVWYSAGSASATRGGRYGTSTPSASSCLTTTGASET